MAYHGMVRYGRVWCGLVRCDAERYGMIWYSLTRLDAISQETGYWHKRLETTDLDRVIF